MASPVQIPPVRPQRSFAGPTVLIVVGIFFLLANMGIVHWDTAGRWFAHYWPVLLILWGVIKLLEYGQAQRAGRRPAGIGVGGAFLLIALIAFGLAATQASHLDWEELRDHVHFGDADLQIFGHNYNYEDQIEQAFPAGSSLHVMNDRGAVNVTASDDGKLRVSVHKRISADTQTEADKWNPQTKPQISVSGNSITLSANTQGAGNHSITSDLDISIPRRAGVVISSKHGDVSVLGREGDADISSQHGEVSASDINGKVSLNLDSSSARVSQIAADVSINGRANDVSVEDVKGAVYLNGEFMESVKLAKIAKSVSFKTSRTDMELARLDGDLDLDSGDLRASDVTGPVRLMTRSKDVSLEGVSGDVRLRNENGSVELHVARLGSVEAENRNGDIQIYLPDKSSFQVDAHARNGEVETDFDEIKTNNQDDVGTGTGTVGGGGPHLTLNNEHGGIEIRKGTAAPEPAPVPTPRAPVLPKRSKVPPAPGTPELTDN